MGRSVVGVLLEAPLSCCLQPPEFGRSELAEKHLQSARGRNSAQRRGDSWRIKMLIG